MAIPTGISKLVVPAIAKMWVTAHGEEVLFRSIIEEFTVKQTIGNILTRQQVSRRTGENSQAFLLEVEHLITEMIAEMNAAEAADKAPPE